MTKTFDAAKHFHLHMQALVILTSNHLYKIIKGLYFFFLSEYRQILILKVSLMRFKFKFHDFHIRNCCGVFGRKIISKNETERFVRCLILDKFYWRV